MMSDDAARGFPAFPPQRGRRSTRGQSWWSRAWVQAMEDTSLDADQLRKGRRYANSGQVGTITVSPGRIGALVHGPRDSYEAVVLVDRLSNADWGRFLDQIGARAGHLAALLDGEMPHELVEAAGDAGVPLLPGIGDLDPSCTCDAWELPCQHAAALCYQAAWLLDEDPFILLLLRGRGRDSLLDELQQRMATAASGPVAPADPAAASESGTIAEGNDTVRPDDLPEPPDVPDVLTADALVLAGTEPPPGLAPATLPLLVLDAASRARALLVTLLAGDVPPPPPLDEWHDAVRLAAGYPELSERLADATGRSTALPIAVQAWRYGGAPALDVLESTWTPEGTELARARAELLAAWDDTDLDVMVTDNHLTLTVNEERRQLRLDHDGRWHPYQASDEGWLPAGPPDRDPIGVLAALTT